MSESEVFECSICLESLSTIAKPSKTIALECGHSFHAQCIRQWCKVQRGQFKRCPLCRSHIYKLDDESNDILISIHSEFRNHNSYLTRISSHLTRVRDELWDVEWVFYGPWILHAIMLISWSIALYYCLWGEQLAPYLEYQKCTLSREIDIPQEGELEHSYLTRHSVGLIIGACAPVGSQNTSLIQIKDVYLYDNEDTTGVQRSYIWMMFRQIESGQAIRFEAVVLKNSTRGWLSAYQESRAWSYLYPQYDIYGYSRWRVWSIVFIVLHIIMVFLPLIGDIDGCCSDSCQIAFGCFFFAVVLISVVMISVFLYDHWSIIWSINGNVSCFIGEMIFLI
eukprot:357528_1